MAEAGQQSCEKQKNIISTLLKRNLKKGDTWYLIDTKWFKQWKKYVGYDSWDTSCVGDQTAFPGPIDNGPLFRDKGDRDESVGMLRENLMDELDYVLVPEDAWNKLVNWYGITPEQDPIARKVIEQGMFVKHFKVEVYLMDLKLCKNGDMDKVVSKQFSRADTIDSIEKAMRKLFEIKEDKEVRLWNKYMSNTYEHLNKPDSTVQDSGLYQGQVIVIEHKNEDGTWPRQSKPSSSSLAYSSTSTSTGIGTPSTILESSSSAGGNSRSYSSGYSSNYYSYDTYKGAGSSPGLCGLSNLGNTCFMNSAIQCMMNVPALTTYFQSDEWKQELNLDNPLGMRGEIATTFAELVKTIWSGKYSYTVPKNFKIAVGRFQPQFSGYQQQDSQELMAFLLDGLHEDLNRIKQKPYIERKDDDDREDELMAKEAWENFLKRNDSIIVDIFHGLLKSTLVCPTCQKISVTFDPFLYLSLPLPIKKNRYLEVIFVPMDPMKIPRQYKLSVPKMGTVYDLCKAMSKANDVSADKMVVIDVYNHRFHKVFNLDENLSPILDRDDIFIYEVPVSSADDPDTVILPIYMRQKKKVQNYSYSHVGSQLFGQPLLVAVPRRKCTYSVLYKSVINKMARYVRIPDDNDDWWTGGDKESDGQVNGEVDMQQDENSEEEDANEAESGKNSGIESNSASSSASTSNGEDSSAFRNEQPAKKKPPRLFAFSMVNSSGSAEVDTIKDDGKPVRFSQRSYVAIDWHPKALKTFYDDKAAEDLEIDESMNMQVQQRKQVVQLTECLDLFTTCEKLGEQDPWYCPRCRKHQQATKKFDLWQLPQVMIIHLKRFTYNRVWRDKLDTFVEYPTRGLDMKKWVINPNHGPAVYDLMAVSNHYGGMGGGHYTAYCQNHEDSKWYYFDDSSVSSATEESVVTKAGYVLVYQRRDLKQNGTGHSSAANNSSKSDLIISNGENGSEEMETN